MGDYTISISSKLITRLASNEEKQKPKKTRKQPKPKPLSQEPDDRDLPGTGIGRPLHHQQQPLFLPIPLPPLPFTSNSELEAIRAVVRESEEAVERMQKREKEMIHELTERAKELHEKEFKLPKQKPMPCLAEKDACLECYRENTKDPLRCANAVKLFSDCARRAQKQMN